MHHDFEKKIWKILFFNFLMKIVVGIFKDERPQGISWYGIFQITFYVRVPFNNIKNHSQEKNPEKPICIFLLKLYNIPLMHFASLTLERSSLNHADNRFSSKNWKINFFIFFFKIIQYPFNGIFHISFCVRVPLNNTKNHFHKKKTRKPDFYIFVIKWYNIPLMHFASLNPWGRSSLNHRRQ